MYLQQYLNTLLEGNDLTQEEAIQLVHLLTDPTTDPLLVASFLTALRMKGETTTEITGFVQGMRKKMTSVSGGKDAIDIVGTGGDGKGTVNISTASSFVVAGAGVAVAKHGNRAASSTCGSADVLEALGVNIQLDNQKAAQILQKVGMVFLFAPLFHPAMKSVVPVRQTLKIRTIFNYLGPFLNPAGVQRQLMGVADVQTANSMVEVGKKLHYKSLLIVTSADGMDEISLFAKTHAFLVQGRNVQAFTIDPKQYGFTKGSFKHIVGNDAKYNAKAITSVLSGEKGTLRDMIMLNSAYALIVAGAVKTVEEGLEKASISIDSGSAKKVLENLQKETNI